MPQTEWKKKTPRRTKFSIIWYFQENDFLRIRDLESFFVWITSYGKDPYPAADFFSNFEAWIFSPSEPPKWPSKIDLLILISSHSKLKFHTSAEDFYLPFWRSNESKSLELLTFKHNSCQFYVNLFHLNDLNEEWLAVFCFYFFALWLDLWFFCK